MNLTKHAIERGEERLGLSLDAFARTARTALTLGFKHKETAGKFNRYLSSLYLSHRSADNIRIYGEHIYLFAQETLITVLNVPCEFKASLAKMRERAR